MAALRAPPEAVSAFLHDERSHSEGHPPLARADDEKRLANAAGAGAPAYVVIGLCSRKSVSIERSQSEGHPPLALLDDRKRLANAAGAGAPAYVVIGLRS